MSRRKRILLCLCVLIVAAIGVVILWNQPRSKPSASVTFVGYTNVPIRGFGLLHSPRTALFAMLRVTNTGPVAVYSWAVSTYGRITIKEMPIEHLAEMFMDSLPSDSKLQILKPGQALNLSLPMRMEPEDVQLEPWSADVFIGRWAARERFYSWVYASGPEKARSWIRKKDPKSEVSKITFSPVTNQPPSSLSPAATPVPNSTKAE